MEKYSGQNCGCVREQRKVDTRCSCDEPMYHREFKHHRHDGVDTMTLAMMYVPWQHWDQIYCPEDGLSYGTIFPELNKPFYGKEACRR